MKPSATIVKIISVVVVAALAVLALTGGIDKAADNNLDAAMKATGAIYATARGINALVSVLQGTELDLPFVTLAIGEVLDPVNDLIERFATIVLFALGAVAGQKVLLLLVSSEVFNYAFAGIAVVTGLVVATQRVAVYAPVLKLFLIAVFVRFALSIVVIANHWVDATFLGAIDEQRHAAMKSFEGELKTVKDLATRNTEFAHARDLSLKKIQQLESALEEGAKQLQATTQDLAKGQARLDQQLKNEDRLCRLSALTPALSPTCSATVTRLLNEQEQEQQQRDAIESRIADVRDQLQDERAEIECIDLRSTGQACSLWDRIPAPPDIGVIQNKLNGLDDKLGDFTENAWLLLVSLLLKSVTIPLVFIFLLFKGIGFLWRTDLGKYLRD